jgi:hypothetical protein
MWAERERWRQRLRVCVFLVAVSTLVTAWWRYERDPGSMPALLSPIDKWISDSTPPDGRSTPAAAAGPNSDRGGAAPGTSGVGTTGRTANPDVTYRTGAGGQVRSGTVDTPRRSDMNRVVPDQTNKDKATQPVPCEPGTAQGSKVTRPESGNDAVPCDEDSPESGADAAPSASR